MRRNQQKRLLVAGGIAVSAAILAYLIFENYSALVTVGHSIQGAWVWAALGCSAASYVMVGLALKEVLLILGFTLTLPELLGIGLVSTTANYFVSTAGVSGFALKAHLLRKRGVPYGSTVTASVVSSAILYLVLAVIIGQGLVYLFFNMRGTSIAILEGVLGLAVLSAVAAPVLVMFLNRELRGRVTRKLFHWANHGVYFFSQSEIPREDFDEFEEQLGKGLERLREGGHGLLKTVAYTCLDWLFCMATLLFAFRAVGIRLPIGHLSAGFTAGQAATLLPILPGGLGVVEGSMAAVFKGLGVDWEKALVAVLLYRLAYYAVPGIVSVFVLWGLKVSEPALLEDTVRDTLPEELIQKAEHLERQRRQHEHDREGTV
jgi:uncharacterized protein (TIRG00374 family)